MSGRCEPMVANLFHAGNTCPFCQEAVAEGQLIVKCALCGSLHHDTCWTHKGGCSSYHCDEKVSAAPGELKPDFVVTAPELSRIVVPPKLPRRGAAEVARPDLPRAPTRLGRLAILSVMLAGVAGVGLMGLLVADASQILLLGVVLAMAALVLGVLAMVFINTKGKVRGSAPAMVGVLVSGGLVVVYFALLGGLSTSHMHSDRVIFQMTQSQPDEAELARMPAAMARALQANVVITASEGSYFGGGMVYGSGIILKVEGRQACILTNRHVISGGSRHGDAPPLKRIDVLFYNGEKSSATVAWTAPEGIDLAVITCQVLSPLKAEPPAPFDALAAQGEAVFAIGNPESLAWSYTEGVISSVRRQQMGKNEIEIYQTQTPINSGNSGGGLYGKDGRLIGVNTWTRDKSASEGLNFAISTRSLLKLMDSDERTRFLQTPHAGDAPAGGEGQTP